MYILCGFELWHVKEIFLSSTQALEPIQSLFSMVTGVLSGFKAALALTTHFHLTLSLRMSGTVPILSNTPSWLWQGSVYFCVLCNKKHSILVVYVRTICDCRKIGVECLQLRRKVLFVLWTNIWRVELFFPRDCTPLAISHVFSSSSF